MGEYERTYKRIEQLEKDVKYDNYKLEITELQLQIAQKELAYAKETITDECEIMRLENAVKDAEELLEVVMDNLENDQYSLGETEGYLLELKSIDGED